MQAYRTLWELPRALWVLAGANFVNRFGAMVLAFLAVYYVKVLGMSLPAAGTLVAAYSWGALLSAPLSAYLCRHLSAWSVMGLSLGSSGVVMAFYPSVTDPVALAPLTFLLGCSAEVARPAGYTCIGQLAPIERRRPAFTLHRLSVNLGMSFGPALGGFLATIDYRYIFWFDGATSVIAALVLLSWRARVTPSLPKPTPTPKDEPALPRSFYSFIVGNFLGLLVFTQLFAGVPLYTVELLGRSEAQTGILFTVNTLLVLLLEAPITQATLSWSLPRALALGQLLQGLGTGLMAAVPDYRGVVWGVILFSFGEMLQAPACPAFINSSVSPGRLAQANGWLAASGSITFIIGPPLTAWSLAELGGPRHWTIVACLGGLSALWMLTLKNPEAPQERPKRTCTAPKSESL